MTPSQKEVNDCLLRALWVLVERAGGKITVPDSSMTGVFRCEWGDGKITVTIAEDHSDKSKH